MSINFLIRKLYYVCMYACIKFGWILSYVLWGAFFNLQHVDWLDEEGKQFLRTHMDIGDSYEAAISCLHQWKEFHGDVNVRTIFVVHMYSP